MSTPNNTELISVFETKRRVIQSKLEALLGSGHVYFQPPENVKIAYPAFVYERAKPDIKRADNSAYLYTHCFSITYIRKDNGDDLPEMIVRAFDLCSEDRTFISNNLYHTVFKLYI